MALLRKPHADRRHGKYWIPSGEWPKRLWPTSWTRSSTYDAFFLPLRLRGFHAPVRHFPEKTRKIMLPTRELRAVLHYVVHCDSYIAQILADSKRCCTAKRPFPAVLGLHIIKLG